MATRQAPAGTIDEYIATFSPGVQKILEKIRRTIRNAAPAAEETISYQMPTFKLNGVLVHFAAFKEHIGFFPPVRGDAKLVKAVARYAGPKGNLRFPLDEPIPYDLIGRIIKLRVKLDAAKTGTRKASRRNKEQSGQKGKSRIKKYILHHKNGTVWAKGQTIDGTPTGYWEWFRVDGTILRSGTFENGEQVGDWTTYDNKGKVYKVTKMKPKAK